ERVDVAALDVPLPRAPFAGVVRRRGAPDQVGADERWDLIAKERDRRQQVVPQRVVCVRARVGPIRRPARGELEDAVAGVRAVRKMVRAGHGPDLHFGRVVRERRLVELDRVQEARREAARQRRARRGDLRRERQLRRDRRRADPPPHDVAPADGPAVTAASVGLLVTGGSGTMRWAASSASGPSVPVCVAAIARAVAPCRKSAPRNASPIVDVGGRSSPGSTRKSFALRSSGSNESAGSWSAGASIASTSSSMPRSTGSGTPAPYSRMPWICDRAFSIAVGSLTMVLLTSSASRRARA